MTLDEELAHYKNELSLVRTQITKIRNTHVSSYSYSGNSATYLDIEKLVKEENRLLSNIRKLEAAKVGNINHALISGYIRFS